MYIVKKRYQIKIEPYASGSNVHTLFCKMTLVNFSKCFIAEIKITVNSVG